MKSQITITWNPDLPEETKVTYSEGFEKELWIAKLDCLRDAIFELTQKYNLVLTTTTPE